mgnify:CR=1 FL=1
MKLKLVIFLLVAGLGVPHASAQQQQPPDPLQGSLFPPELVMQNQQALGLTAEQKEYFKSEIRQAQERFTGIQWKLQDEMEKLAALLKPPQSGEQQVLDQLEKVLAYEREVKRAQISLLIRIKNKLTPEQQARLRDIQSKAGAR